MRLIDADALLDKFEWKEDSPLYIRAIRAKIKAAPSIVAVKRGRWNGYNVEKGWTRDDGTPVFLVCSVCNGVVLNNGSAHWNYCPNCGADMRERKES